MKLVFTAEGNKNFTLHLNFISGKDIQKINKNYLKHNYVTDIITFPYTKSDKMIDGEIFISLEQVKKNSKAYNEYYKDEIRRVIIHGCLHLLGYDDRTRKQAGIMREKENYYLSK